MREEEDVEIEAEDPEADAKAESKVKKQKGEIEKLRKERQEYLDGWQRAKADYVNALKRFEEEKRSASEAGILRAVGTLLPAYDAIERAKEHGELPKGFEAIVKQLEAAFKELGVEAVGKEGEHFNPALHEALSQEATDDKEKDNTIVAVLETGYRVNGFVIRPAKVKVAQSS
jgi:molecular chaperone GrpE